jgi:coenzyme F420 hydrogenase subunit delta
VWGDPAGDAFRAAKYSPSLTLTGCWGQKELPVLEPDQTVLPDFCLKPTLILGCGNILFGDDGFGCAVVEYLEAHYPVPEDVCLLDVGTGVRKVLFTLCLSPVRPRRVLILDALDVGREPGEVFEIDPKDIPAIKCDDFSVHQLPTSNLLRELEEQCGVEVRVLGCQTGPLPEEICPGLSEPVRRALPVAAERVVTGYFPRGASACEDLEAALHPARPVAGQRFS